MLNTVDGNYAPLHAHVDAAALPAAYGGRSALVVQPPAPCNVAPTLPPHDAPLSKIYVAAGAQRRRRRVRARARAARRRKCEHAGALAAGRTTVVAYELRAREPLDVFLRNAYAFTLNIFYSAQVRRRRRAQAIT